MIAGRTDRHCYSDADGIEIFVYINRNIEVRPLMSVFLYVGAYSDRLNARRLVLEMRLDGHVFLTSVSGHNVLTACSGWLCRRVHIEDRSVA